MMIDTNLPQALHQIFMQIVLAETGATDTFVIVRTRRLHEGIGRFFRPIWRFTLKA
jgi:hypothetical protein